MLDVRLPGMDGFEMLRRAARRRQQGAGAVAHGARRGDGQGHRPGAGRRRLPDQAVRAARADEPHQGAAAARVRRPGRRGRRPRNPPPATCSSTWSAGASSAAPSASASPRPSSRSCATWPQRPGRVFSRRELLELVRDYEALDQDEKTINVHVSHLREKLEDDPSDPSFILTVRGAGYAFAERSDRASPDRACMPSASSSAHRFRVRLVLAFGCLVVVAMALVDRARDAAAAAGRLLRAAGRATSDAAHGRDGDPSWATSCITGHDPRGECAAADPPADAAR